MKKNLYKIFLASCIVIVLLFAGCTSNDNTEENNQDAGDTDNSGGSSEGDTNGEYQDGSLSAPVYPDATTPPFTDDSLWVDFNVDLSLNRAMYFSDTSVEDIYDWYYDNAGDWEVKKRYLTENPNNPGTIAQGEVYLKSNDEGVYILINDASSMPMGSTCILGVAQGSWELVSACGIVTSGEDAYGIGSGSVTFSITPMGENDYYAITPLGAVSGGDHTFPTDHGGFLWDNPENYPPSYDVVVPYGGVITEIRYTKSAWPSGSGQSGTYNDYRVRIEHTNEFRSFIGHISELDDTILAQTGTLSEGDNRFFDEPIEVEMSDILGKAGGRPGAQTALIWWIIDESVTLNYANPDRYNQFAHAVHFITCCEESLQTKLISKLGGGSPFYHTRTADPLWGKVDFDESGKLVGNWFEENIDPDDPMAYYEKHLSFVYNMWDPTKITIGVGGTLGITATVYNVDGNTPDPATVTISSGQTVYNLHGTEDFGEASLTATILVELVGDDRIKIEGFTGTQSSPSFTSNAKYYIR